MKKQPKQKRSEVIVESVLEASARILSKIRLKQVSTNKIAQEAGVGIGSLYDYFPNKNAIAITLMDRRMEKVVLDFEQLLHAASFSLETLVEDSLEFIVKDFFSKRAFLREIFFLAPESGRMESLHRARIQSTNLLKNHLIQTFKKDPKWAELKSFLLIHSLLGILESYIMIEEADFDLDQLKLELKNMMRFLLEI